MPFLERGEDGVLDRPWGTRDRPISGYSGHRPSFQLTKTSWVGAALPVRADAPAVPSHRDEVGIAPTSLTPGQLHSHLNQLSPPRSPQPSPHRAAPPAPMASPEPALSRVDQRWHERPPPPPSPPPSSPLEASIERYRASFPSRAQTTSGFDYAPLASRPAAACTFRPYHVPGLAAGLKRPLYPA